MSPRLPAVLLLLLLLLLLQFAASSPLAASPRRQLLLVSLDGFRHDYLQLYANQSLFLNQLAARGVLVRQMSSTFVTKTFPCHWTIATGRYQESHGIVSNTMYDPVFDATFKKQTVEERWWNDSLPIWISAKRQGLKVATALWPGSEVSFNGDRPHFWQKYTDRGTFHQRALDVVKWLTEERVDFAALYFNEPDSAGHRHGPDSNGVAAAVGRVNDAVQLVASELQRRGFGDRVDIIVTSDHGMASVSHTRVVNFNGSLDSLVDRVLDRGPILTLNAKEGKQQQLLEELQRQQQEKQLPIRVFSRDTMPQELHYSRHRRIPDVLVLPEGGWQAIDNGSLKSSLYLRTVPGNHGYDNGMPEMRVPLIAVGPSFRDGVEVTGLRQVDVYGLMCRLLRIQPQPNNGSLLLLPSILRDDSGGAAGVVASVPLCCLAVCAAAAARLLLLQ